MSLFVDNTGLHSAGRCLAGESIGTIDVRGLLQLATEIIFSDIVVCGYEYKSVREESENVLQLLKQFGVEDSCISTVMFSSRDYAGACDKAAQKFSEDFDSCFPFAGFSSENLIRAAWTVAPSAVENFKELGQRLIAGTYSKDERNAAADVLAVYQAAGSVCYMLATCDDLLAKIRDFRKTEGWTDELTDQLIIGLRYYANEELALAGANKHIYAPAVARAEIVRKSTRLLSQRLSHVIGKVAEELSSPLLISVPSVAGALVYLSKGDPRAVISEAARLRDIATELRTYLRGKFAALDPTSQEYWHEVNMEVGELTRDLNQEVRLTEAPNLINALDIHPLPPFISARVGSIKDWIEFRKARKRIVVLTELSKALEGSAIAGDMFQKLVVQSSLKA